MRRLLLLRRGRSRFLLRLLVPLVLTLAVVGAVQFSLLRDSAHDELIEEAQETLRADAGSIEQVYDDVNAGEVAKNDLNRALRAIAARPGIEDATLVGIDGRNAFGNSLLGIGLPFGGPAVRGAVRSGREWVRERSERFVFVAPVELEGDPYGLVVRRDRSTFAARLDDLRSTLLLVLLGGLGIAVPVFYLTGGRRLVALHRAALQRTTRDGLTDLGNHHAFREEIGRALSASDRQRRPLTLAMLDIDDFKYENDRLGHRHGDRILHDVAEALAGLRGQDRAFRVASDEFALLLPDAEDRDARVALERVRDEIARRAGVTVSAGVATCGPGTDVDALRDEADAAMVAAKRRGGDRLVSFHEIESDARILTPGKVRAVRQLLEEEAIEAVFQPIWDLRSNELLGVEALARPAERFELSGPAEAFAVAEAIGHGAELDELCRRRILESAGDLPDGALLFVNVSPVTLDLERLNPDELAASVRAAGLDPGRVVLEMTERFSGRTERVVRGATALRDIGFKLALDDVGAGNSGLEMLKDLPVDCVKIDREVVVKALSEPMARAVLISIMAFAGQTGAYVVAEGIETAEMLDFVRDPGTTRSARPGAQAAQGFLLGRPGPMPSGEHPEAIAPPP